MTLPNGGVCARCQRVKKNGVQCGNPARVGFNVCPRHGAGFKAREDAGMALPTGRPVVHGLYSKTGKQSIHDLISEVETSGSLKSTDREIATLKAALWFLLEQSDARQQASKDLGSLLEHMRNLKPSTPEDIQAARALIFEARGLQTSLDSWLSRVQDSSSLVLNAAKIRADIHAKTAQDRALTAFQEWTNALRHIIWDIMDDPEKLDIFELRVQQEIFAPMRAKIEFAALQGKSAEDIGTDD
jgi:hypothetical protein